MPEQTAAGITARAALRSDIEVRCSNRSSINRLVQSAKVEWNTKVERESKGKDGGENGKISEYTGRQ